MTIDTSEGGFEGNIEQYLLESGYESLCFDKPSLASLRSSGIDKKMLWRFLEATQEKELNHLRRKYSIINADDKILERILNEVDRKGLLDVLRHGVRDRGVHLKLMYNKPETELNRTLVENHEKNIFAVSRQVYYTHESKNSLDMVLFVNGFPLIVMELKNQLTNQSVFDGMKQFRETRSPKELMFQFNKRALVYFAVDTDEVYMTTELKAEHTKFLPFNLGNQGGKGNPTCEDNYRTYYLWENVLQQDSLLDIIFKFTYIKKDDIKDSNGELLYQRKTLIFPRYHQLDVVRRIEEDVRKVSVGQNYLIQHSAGSGKTNSISWLAHRLSKMHTQDNKAIFNSVIVITDRRVLDKQLQDAVYQLEHKAGTVERIDKDSTQLAQAIQSSTRIVITTLQKFPYVLDKLAKLSNKQYAIVIDEAHSSQGGKSSKAMSQVLSNMSLEEAYEQDRLIEENLTDVEEMIVEDIVKSGKQTNVSYFAFTATPKPKTLERFGRKNSEGHFVPFHLYSMRQAIEEGFILDVLQNYTTYKTYYNIISESDEKVLKSEATKKIGRFVSLHPHNISQKVEVIVEHFKERTQHKLNGHAKAMLVTSSRLHAVRYKLAMDEYIKKRSYRNMETLVAFSGKIEDGSEDSYTESKMNGFSENELPNKFHSPDFQVLIVAEKYQTGFDEPLLQTMYVDKPLSGVKAVQTLSRLNRTCPGKSDTFILDFVNETDEIQKAFQPYYETTALESETDPNLLYELKDVIDQSEIVTFDELDKLAKIVMSAELESSAKGQGKLNSVIDKGVERFGRLDNENQDIVRDAMIKYLRTYGFLLQIIDFADIELHKMYLYVNYLIRKLPKKTKDTFTLPDDVALKYYKIKESSSGTIGLEKNGFEYIQGVGNGVSSVVEEEKVNFSDVIDKLNERFGTEFKPEDKLFMDQITSRMNSDEMFVMKARNNSFDNFVLGVEKQSQNILIDKYETNSKFVDKYLTDGEFKEFVLTYMLKDVYEKVHS
ncbi:type I restriction endonuclease subunit R [Listeria seeligeri]|uniref:type I restriction endonuclease subunit R n=1 Tax=Listeria seeligeri TaxID=1640 RepID=UPI0010B07B68|nr:type I restriction endonuclease [Listeria seeligeri]